MTARRASPPKEDVLQFIEELRRVAERLEAMDRTLRRNAERYPVPESAPPVEEAPAEEPAVETYLYTSDGKQVRL